MSLKVIAGVYGGRVLRTVRGLGTRPLLGQVKAAVFNILAEQVPGALVWDLFAGTGASGIEALSRGARQAAFLEKNNKAIEVLRSNLRLLGAEAASVVLRGDAWEPPVLHAGVLAGVRADAPPGDAPRADTPRADTPLADGSAPDAGAADGEVAPDLIFLDPPYALVVEDPVKCLWRARRLVQRLAPGGCLVFHFEAGALDEDDFDADLTVDLREWGSSAIAFLWRAGEAPSRVVRRRERALSGD
jgi:16S rRNA (guanine966-N2)-methyltransferase